MRLPGQIGERLANSFGLRLTILVLWITVVMLGLYVGVGLRSGMAELLTILIALPLFVYLEFVLATPASPRRASVPAPVAETQPQPVGARTAVWILDRLWLAEGLVALGAGALMAASPAAAGALLNLARSLPGLASLSDGLAIVHPDSGFGQSVVVYLAVWWLTLPVKAVAAYLDDQVLRARRGDGGVTRVTSFRSAIYILVGSALAWGAPAVVFWYLGRGLLAGRADFAAPLSLQYAFLVGPLVNGPLIAWAVWSAYGFVVALLLIDFVRLADSVRFRVVSATRVAFTRRGKSDGGPDAGTDDK